MASKTFQKIDSYAEEGQGWVVFQDHTNARYLHVALDDTGEKAAAAIAEAMSTPKQPLPKLPENFQTMGRGEQVAFLEAAKSMRDQALVVRNAIDSGKVKIFR